MIVETNVLDNLAKYPVLSIFELWELLSISEILWILLNISEYSRALLCIAEYC